jgi:hypothetical protein
MRTIWFFEKRAEAEKYFKKLDKANACVTLSAEKNHGQVIENLPEDARIYTVTRFS